MKQLRDTILNADDVHIEIVDVPEWGVKIGVKGLTLAEQTRFLNAVRERTGSPQADFRIDKNKFGPQLIIRCCVDPDTGEPVFEAADAQAIQAKSAKANSRIIKVATRLSGLGGDEQVEELIDDLKGTADDE